MPLTEPFVKLPVRSLVLARETVRACTFCQSQLENRAGRKEKRTGLSPLEASRSWLTRCVAFRGRQDHGRVCGHRGRLEAPFARLWPPVGVSPAWLHREARLVTRPSGFFGCFLVTKRHHHKLFCTEDSH